MKKLMFAVAAMAAGVAVADGITSANCVGYQSHGDPSGFNNIAAAFEPMNEAKKWTFTDNVYDTQATAGDQVAMLNTDVFDLDYYEFKGNDPDTGASLGWSVTTTDPDSGEYVFPEVASFEVGKSQVTYCTPSDGVSPFTTAGQVDDLNGTTVTFDEPGMYDITNPYPIDTTLADLATFFQAGDTLSVLNTDLFDLDYYAYNGSGAAAPWTQTTTDPDTGDYIFNDITDQTIVILPAGKGGYYEFYSDTRTWNVSLKK